MNVNLEFDLIDAFIIICMNMLEDYVRHFICMLLTETNYSVFPKTHSLLVGGRPLSCDGTLRAKP